MTTNVGFATLSVIPSMQGFQQHLERGTNSPLTAAGKRGGTIFGKAMGTSAGSVFRSTLGALGVFAAGSAALRFLGDSVEEGRQAVKIGAQTRAVIKSTGGVAKVSEKQVGRLANQLKRMSGIDDEVIQSGSNVLLTFKNIRNEAGENNKIFDKANKASLNLSVALGKDLNSSALMVGKALNDPVAGMTALGRAGVQFSQDQKDAIKKMVETGDTLGAQKAILRELNDQFRGSAKAQRTEADRLSTAWGDFKEEVGTALIPVLDDLATFLRKKGIPAAKDFFGWVRDDGIPMAKDFGAFAKDAAGHIKDLVGFLNDLPKPAKIAGITALLGAFGASKLRGGGGGALGTAGKVLGLTKPVPVFVTNPGFGGAGGPGGKIGKFGLLGAAGTAGLIAAISGAITLGVGKVLEKSGDERLLSSGSGGTSSGASTDFFDLDGTKGLDGVPEKWDEARNAANDYLRVIQQQEQTWDVNRGKAADYFTLLQRNENPKLKVTVTGLDLAIAQTRELIERLNEARSIRLGIDGEGLGGTNPPNRSPGGTASSTSSNERRGGGVTIQNQTVVAHDYKDFVQQSNRRNIGAASDGQAPRR